jgi:hypothetical protein
MATIKKAQTGVTTKKTPAKKVLTKNKAKVNESLPAGMNFNPNLNLRKEDKIKTEMSKNGKSVKKAQMGGFISNEFGAKSLAKSKPKAKLMDSKVKTKKDIYAFEGKKGMLAKTGAKLKKK